MEVHVQVAVQVRESEASRREGGELRLDLAPELDAAAASHVLPGVAQAGQDRTVPEAARPGHEMWDLRGRRGGPSLCQHQVKADGEARMLLRERHGLGRRLARHHEARAGEDARTMRADDGGVHLPRRTEVVATHDETT